MRPKDIGILIIDNDDSVRESLSKHFKIDGYRVGTADKATAAIKKIEESPWDIILLDIKIPGMDSAEIRRRIKQVNKNIITIIITDFVSVKLAVRALQEGAFEYVVKPIDPDDLNHLIRNAVEQRRLVSENIQLRQRLEELYRPDEIIGESRAIKNVMEMVFTVAKTESPIMIRGESGSGKELISRAIHSSSNRKYFPIISINCGAYPNGLLKKELFGYEKDVFVGATNLKEGKLEMTDKGTVFLDEIGNMSNDLQKDFLEVIENKQLTRLGGDKSVEVDLRIICATSKNLEEALKNKSFREDLYYRLNIVSISLPPVRERKSDIPLLINHFIHKYAESMNKKMMDLSPEALAVLTGYDWPGNIRELRNVVERAVAETKTDRIELENLFSPFHPQPKFFNGASLEDVERMHTKNTLEQMKWNVARAAKILKISRLTLYNKIKKYDLKKSS